MAKGAPTADELRDRLGGAPGLDDAELDYWLEGAIAYVRPLLAPEWEKPEDWPEDLHDGILLGATLSYRNAESPSASSLGAWNADGSPAPPPIVWWPRVRQRVAQYLSAGVWVG